MKVWIIGLDGATFKSIDLLVKKGILPNFKYLFQNGCRAILKSTMPFFTGPAWVSMVTGVNPGKHGIFNFTKRIKGESKRRVLSSQDIKCPKIWNILNQYNKKTGMLNIPMTYPSEEVNGFMITGMMSPEINDKVSHPKNLIYEIDRYVNGYIIDIPVILEKHQSDFSIIDKLNECLFKRYKAVEFLLDNYDLDFFMVVFVILDRLHHLFWKILIHEQFVDNSFYKKVKEKLIESYSHVDKIVGKIIQRMDDKIVLFITSDHGFGDLKKGFYLNNWLISKNILRLKTRNTFKSIILSLLSERQISLIKKFIPRKLIADYKEKLLEDIIDYSKTIAYSAHSLEQGIYVNDKENKQQVLKYLIQALERLTDPETNEKIVKEIFTKESLYSGPFVDEAPDILINTADNGYELSDAIIKGEFLVSKESTTFGIHNRDGIFIAYGDIIKKGVEMPETNIVDIAPTALYAINIPIPTYMDGKILKNIFTENFLQQYPERYKKTDLFVDKASSEVFTEDESEEIKERLKGLGYF